MNEDSWLLLAAIILLYASAFLRLRLYGVKKQPLRGFLRWQGVLLPTALLVTLAVYRLTGRDFVIPVLLAGAVEEGIGVYLRRKQAKESEDEGPES